MDATYEVGEPLKPLRDGYEEVHVTLEDGRKIYWPKGDMARLAPGAVCNIAGRIVDLRAILDAHGCDIPPAIRQKLEMLARPVPYEAAWFSGKSIEVHNALKEFGASLQ